MLSKDNTEKITKDTSLSSFIVFMEEVLFDLQITALSKAIIVVLKTLAVVVLLKW